MGLFSENTAWYFLLAAESEPEERHLYDVAYGISCLETKSVNSENIHVFVDGADRRKISSLVNCGAKEKVSIDRSIALFDAFINNRYDNIVLFITGHGSVYGINGVPKITPFQLIRSMKCAHSLKSGVIYLGQCYAGIFNYSDVEGRTGKSGKGQEAPLAIIGATNLYTSISYSTKEQMLKGYKSWQANIFLLNLFRWLKKPEDIDGDGKLTVVDSYRFAGYMTNDFYKTIKCSLYTTEKYLYEQYLKAIEAEKKYTMRYPHGRKKDKYSLETEAAKTAFEQTIAIRYNHQEPWILHSKLAQRIEF